MSYTAYETASGEALAQVSSLCRHAARFSGAFSPSTIPTLAAVERYLTTSRAWISGKLRLAGLSDVQTDAEVLGVLQELNVYDVCAKVELSLPQESGTGDGNERFQEFVKRRDDLLEMIADGTLAAMDATTTGAGTHRLPIVTGLSISRKRLAEDDTDATQHRVRRDQFKNPSSILPIGETGWNEP